MTRFDAFDAFHSQALICFSHLRWNFVYQRPQHLMSRAAARRRVVFVEEPIFDAPQPCLETNHDRSGVSVVTPHMPPNSGTEALQAMLDFYLSAHEIHDYVSWYYTPMALKFSAHLKPAAIVYDCMDELSAFAGAPAGLREAERTLLMRADVVLTGGHSLFVAKRDLHPNVKECPSSVDVEHFGRARAAQAEPADQRSIPRPRVGYFGVIDERLDRELLAGIAAQSPGWHFVMVGPVVKIDASSLPVAPNLHYLGQKTYADLPSYIGGWDVAMLPFARNEATRFISPTKTPEYLAAGRPVVSTSIADVVKPYGELGLAHIADTSEDFTAAVRAALCQPADEWLPRADAFLAGNSWDATWTRIEEWIESAIAARSAAQNSARQRAQSSGSRRLAG